MIQELLGVVMLSKANQVSDCVPLRGEVIHGKRRVKQSNNNYLKNVILKTLINTMYSI